MLRFGFEVDIDHTYQPPWYCILGGNTDDPMKVHVWAGISKQGDLYFYLG